MCDYVDLITFLLLVGSQGVREAALAELRALVAGVLRLFAHPPTRLQNRLSTYLNFLLITAPVDPHFPTGPVLEQDLRHADVVIARAMKKGSWSRNKAWALKFAQYARGACPHLVRALGLRVAVMSNRVTLAFLANVVRHRPKETTSVKAAKRALNFLRSLCGSPSLDEDPNIRLLARAARNSVARTVRQSPGMPVSFLRVIYGVWGSSRVWWQRMVALMALLGLCTVARGAEVVSCLREGMAWVRHDGTQVRSPYFVPVLTAGPLGPDPESRVKGFMVLLPSRKNRQASPTWIPVIATAVISLMAVHVGWLDSVRGPRCGCLFPARVSARRAGRRVYVPASDHNAAMSVDSFRRLLRQALVQCCGITQSQASQYGTHSLRIGAVEYLRSVGVSAEVRQQLGGWMSASSALGYLQLPISAQFNILNTIFR